MRFTSFVPLLLVGLLQGCAGADDDATGAGGSSAAGAATGGTGNGGAGGLGAAGGMSGSVASGGSSSGGTASGGVAALGGTAGGSGLGAGGAGGSLGGAGSSGAGSGGAAGTDPAGGSSGSSVSGGAGMGGTAGSGAGGATGSSGGAGATGTPGVRIVGRTASGSGGAVRFSWPGVSIQARFTGTQVSIDLNDGNNKNRFTVVVDGGAPKTVTSPSGQASLSLASGLSTGTHDITIWRNTEAAMGITEFTALTGFGTGGELLAPPPAPERRIEVIGDSLSVGAGDEGPGVTCSPNIDAFTNNYLAYGSVAARSVSAELVTIAWSGIGVYRSYSSSDPTMPARYDDAISNDKTPWEFSKYQPHVVVINLGTNDFGSGNPGQPYVTAYVDFVEHVRSKYAAANFILVDMYGGERQTALDSVVSALKGGGESKVETLSFSSVPNNNTACNQHPNVAAQEAMGNLLSARLKSLMGW